MTRRISVALVNLSLCGLLALSGCKSSHPMGFAEKTTPESAAESASSTQFASAGVVREEARPTEEPGAKPASSYIAQTLRKATSWFPFQRSDDSALKQARTLDREWTPAPALANSGRLGVAPNNPVQPGALANRQSSFRSGALSRHDAPLIAPSLVRRSRRPPPDPAPKPPQEELLATKTLTRNPYVPSTAGAHTSSPPTRGKLSRMIGTASRSWRADAAGVGVGNVAANHTSNNAELKFSPPDIKKNGAAPDAQSLELAKGSSEAKRPETSGQRQTKKRRYDTIPRREDMLARRTRSSNKTASTKPFAGKPPVTVPTAKWVAKKTLPATASPEMGTEASTVSNAPADSKRVVADTVASGLFAPRRPAKRPTSTGSLPSNRALAIGLATPRTRTNPRAARKPPVATPSSSSIAGTPARTSRVAVASRPTVPMQNGSTNPTAATPSRIAKSTAAQPFATNDGAPAKTDQRHTAAWQRPVPFAPSRNGYQSYYDRGATQNAGVLTHQPRHPAAVVSQGMKTNTAAPPAHQPAPLIDADSYRQQTAQRQQGNAATPVSAVRPTAYATWLTTYQKLVRGAPSSRQPSSAPDGATIRSLNSRQ